MGEMGHKAGRCLFVCNSLLTKLLGKRAAFVHPIGIVLAHSLFHARFSMWLNWPRWRIGAGEAGWRGRHVREPRGVQRELRIITT
jgi:hypothetical protein